MKQMRILTIGSLLLGLCAVEGLAGDGVVALQTADPSCPDDSGDIYVDCGNGTVTDNRTGLVWLENASCLGSLVDWSTAMEFVASLADLPAASAAAADDCGLSDGSSAGEWRLPSVAEWEAMVDNALGEGGDPDCKATPPTITNDSGGGCWATGPSSFSDVQSAFYWSTTTNAFGTGFAWRVSTANGSVTSGGKDETRVVWPVRGGQ